MESTQLLKTVVDLHLLWLSPGKFHRMPVLIPEQKCNAQWLLEGLIFVGKIPVMGIKAQSVVHSHKNSIGRGTQALTFRNPSPL